MPTLENFDGRSLAIDLQKAFGPAVQEYKQRRQVKEITDLAATAAGLPSVPDENAGGFLRKIAPGLADRIQGLNSNRNPDEIDATRNEAKLSLATSQKILAAKSQREKQKIILERADEIQRQGGDASEFLRMAGLSADEIDLKAQKGAMTSDATLKALPAPTDEERFRARAELAVRAPEALALILGQEGLAREDAARAAEMALAERQLQAGQQATTNLFGGGQAPTGDGSIPENYYASVIGSESGGDPNARNQRSTATGLGQFTEGTWNRLMETYPELGLTPDGRTDPVQSQRALQAFTEENAQSLRAAGIPVDGGSLYASHFLGAGGARSVLTQPDNVQLTDILPQNVIEANPFLRGMSVGRFREWAGQKGGSNVPAGSPQVEQPQQQRMSAQDVAQLLANPNVPKEVKEFATAEYERQLEADQVEATKFEIKEGADGFLYYVDPTGQQKSRRVNPDIETPEGDTALLKEYSFAVEQGFPGTLIEFEQARKGQGFQVQLADGTTVTYGGPQDQGQGVQPSSPQAMIASIDGILNDPALDSATGVFSFLQAVPGTPQRRFGARAAQLEGQAFLQAFESLKGGGQITEIEGQKATQAIGRLDTAQSPEDYRSALTELRTQLQAAANRPQGWLQTEEGQRVSAQQMQGGDTGAPVQITTDAEYETLPSGTVFIAPDGTQRRKP